MLTAYVHRIVKVDDVQWMRGGRVEFVSETLKQWCMRFLPAAVLALQAEVIERNDNGLLSPVELDCAARAFKRRKDGEGFDVLWEVWENLRTAAGRQYPV